MRASRTVSATLAGTALAMGAVAAVAGATHHTGSPSRAIVRLDHQRPSIVRLDSVSNAIFRLEDKAPSIVRLDGDTTAIVRLDRAGAAQTD